ncbi:hypothetical protein PMIN03_012357 [Paraphaeosphaeria minitans]
MDIHPSIIMDIHPSIIMDIHPSINHQGSVGWRRRIHVPIRDPAALEPALHLTHMIREAFQAREASIRPTSATSLEAAAPSRLLPTELDAAVANARSDMNVIVCRSQASQDV